MSQGAICGSKEPVSCVWLEIAAEAGLSEHSITSVCFIIPAQGFRLCG